MGAMRRPPVRRTIDHLAPGVALVKDRIFRPEMRRRPNTIVSGEACMKELLPPAAYPMNASSSICSKFVHMSSSKDRCPVQAVCWTPGARRLLAGAANGMFTLWNGSSFNFETTQQAHEAGLRCLVWSRSLEFMLSSDGDGVVKYFSTTLNNLKEINAHAGAAVREVSFSPSGTKFVTCGDDATVKVWDFDRAALDRLLPGTDVESGKSHSWDVKTAQWHPSRALIASGAKDNIIRMWDPRAPREVSARTQRPYTPSTHGTVHHTAPPLAALISPPLHSTRPPSPSHSIHPNPFHPLHPIPSRPVPFRSIPSHPIPSRPNPRLHPTSPFISRRPVLLSLRNCFGSKWYMPCQCVQLTRWWPIDRWLGVSHSSLSSPTWLLGASRRPARLMRLHRPLVDPLMMRVRKRDPPAITALAGPMRCISWWGLCGRATFAPPVHRPQSTSPCSSRTHASRTHASRTHASRTHASRTHALRPTRTTPRAVCSTSHVIASTCAWQSYCAMSSQMDHVTPLLGRTSPLLDPKGVDPKAVDPKGVDPKGVDPKGVDPLLVCTSPSPPSVSAAFIPLHSCTRCRALIGLGWRRRSLAWAIYIWDSASLT